MRESRTYGSVRGTRGNSRPYRDRSGIRDGLAMRHPDCAVRCRARLHPVYEVYRDARRSIAR